MAEYYALGAGLPTLRPEIGKNPPLTPWEYVETLRGQLSRRDNQLLDLLLLSEDNRALVALLYDRPIPDPQTPYVVGPDELRRLVTAAERGMVTSEMVGEELHFDPKTYPSYLVDFMYEYRHDQEIDRPAEHFYEDILDNYYFRYVMERGDEFVRTWVRFDRSIRLVLAAITIKRHDLDARRLIVGDSDLVRLLRSGNWHDITFLEEGEVVQQVLQISEEQDLSVREHRIDQLKWDYLDSLTFADTFSIDTMLAYLLKLQMLSRWSSLDAEMGKSRFREIMDQLNHESRSDLEKFRAEAKKHNRL